MYLNTFELLNEIREEIKVSNDRACLILAASFFDELLGNILVEYLIKDKKTDPDLFNAFGPLSTISAKIKISFRLGLISEKEYNQLEIFRKIRNKFAHQLKSKSLGDPDLKDLVLKLKVESNLIPALFYPLPKNQEEVLPKLELVDVGELSPREIIDVFILYMCNNLFGRMIKAITKPSTVPTEFKFYYEPFELASENISNNLKKIMDLESLKNEKLIQEGKEPELDNQSKYENLVEVVNQIIRNAKLALK